MAGKTTPVLLVTANVGSIFEDPSVMLKIWTEEFLSTVTRLDPKFIALHCQEVGGKNYERSMKHVEYFVRLLMSSEELRLFDKVRVYLDEDYSSAENFTALGNFYFIHESVSDIFIWDFTAMSFIPAKGKEVHSGNIEAVSTKEKSKFPQDFFPECKWSRKGFLRTRWSLCGSVFDLINIHLFHDASNFIAMESFPSVYCKNRRRALEHTLERFHNDQYGRAPFFVFGDFNFRTDTQGVIQKLTEDLNPVRVQSNKSSDYTKLQYRNDDSQVILSLGKKEFSHVDHQSLFVGSDGKWLKEFDRELEPFAGRLFEFDIGFPPSYPFEEDEKGANRYMQTRCPSWCDRVILSITAKSLVNNISVSGSVEYGLMGQGTCMGDHKPVYLKAELLADAGTVSCCTFDSAGNEPPVCFGRVSAARVSPCWSCSKSLKATVADVFITESPPLTLSLNTSVMTGYADTAVNHFLAPPHASLLHEPYTPESMETPSSSPSPIRVQRDFGVVDLDEWKLESVKSDEMDVDSKNRKKKNEAEFSGYDISNKEEESSEISECMDQGTKLILGNKSMLSLRDMQVVSSSFHSLKDNDNILSKEKDAVPSSVPCLRDPVKRVQSAYRVGQSLPLMEAVSSSLSPSGIRTCRCFSDSWRDRNATTPALPTQSHSRVRLISSSSIQSSSRLQSHHSSSDEDWFEEVQGERESVFLSVQKGDASNVVDVPVQKIENISNRTCSDVLAIKSPNLHSENVSPEYYDQPLSPISPVFNLGDDVPFAIVCPKGNPCGTVVQSSSILSKDQLRESDKASVLYKKSFLKDDDEDSANGIETKSEDNIQSLLSSRKSEHLRMASDVGSCSHLNKVTNKGCTVIHSDIPVIQHQDNPKRCFSHIHCDPLLLPVSNDNLLNIQVNTIEEDVQAYSTNTINKKQKKSLSKRKLNHCCTMI